MAFQTAAWPWRLLAALGLLLAVWIGGLLATDAWRAVNTKESGLLERSQAGVLLLAAFVWALRARRPRSGTDPSAGPGWRAWAPLLSVVALTGFGRELNWGNVWAISEGPGSAWRAANLVLLLAIIPVAGHRWWRLGRDRLRANGAMLRSPEALLIGFGLLTFLVADLHEKRLITLVAPQLIEEALESFAYFCVLVASYRPWLRQPSCFRRRIVGGPRRRRMDARYRPSGAAQR